MRRDEQVGLVVLIIFLLVGGLLMYSTTDSGQAFGNIFANIVSYDNDPHSPAVEAQFVPIKQQLGSNWLIGTMLGRASASDWRKR